MSRALGNNHTCVISLAFFLDSGIFKLAQTNTSDHLLFLASKKRAFVPLMCDIKQMRKHVMQFRSVFYYNNENMFIKAEMSITHNKITEAIHASPRASEVEASFNFTPGFIFRTEHVTVVTCCHSLSTDVINVMFAEHYTFFFYS